MAEATKNKDLTVLRRAELEPVRLETGSTEMFKNYVGDGLLRGTKVTISGIASGSGRDHRPAARQQTSVLADG